MANTNSMNFQAYLADAWRIIMQEPLILIGGGFLFQLLFIATQGVVAIIAGPLLGGYLLLIILFLRENRRPTFNDIFLGFKQFGHLLPYFLVLLVILIGVALLILPGLLFATWWIYVLPLMVDRKMPFNDAMRVSMNKVIEKGFFMHLVFLLLTTLLPVLLLNILTVALPVFIVLSVLLPPVQFGCLASLYIDQFGAEEPASRPAADTSGLGTASGEPSGPLVDGAAERETTAPTGKPAGHGKTAGGDSAAGSLGDVDGAPEIPDHSQGDGTGKKAD